AIRGETIVQSDVFANERPRTGRHRELQVISLQAERLDTAGAFRIGLRRPDRLAVQMNLPETSTLNKRQPGYRGGPLGDLNLELQLLRFHMERDGYHAVLRLDGGGELGECTG